ncbi:hypothetical protein [Amycolatopsis sp.]|jgi:hypothetical protein|uniref:hypothetical protein n=1 Tax=Amycolatopsis sp. TaxID=37632 RepID=UPI002E0A8C57|nr:hypothetical protein [Amycolatopsis sp.]
MNNAIGLSARRRTQRALARRAATNSGACMCAKFANGSYRSVHNWGQPGCRYEEPVIAQAS